MAMTMPMTWQLRALHASIRSGLQHSDGQVVDGDKAELSLDVRRLELDLQHKKVGLLFWNP